MDKVISSEQLLGFVYEMEKFKASTLEHEVIAKAKLAGFISDEDTADNRAKLAWIKKVTQHAYDAFNLEDIAAGESLLVTIENFNWIVECRDRQVTDTLELLAKYIVNAAPPYKG